MFAKGRLFCNEDFTHMRLIYPAQFSKKPDRNTSVLISKELGNDSQQL
jgi:hypothetical protein